MPLPAPPKIFSVCSSVVAYIMTMKTVLSAAIPAPIQRNILSFLGSHLRLLFESRNPKISIIVEDRDMNGRRNPVFDDAMEFLGGKIRGRGKKVRISRESESRSLSFALAHNDVISDEIEGIKVELRYSKVFGNRDHGNRNGNEFIEIVFEERHRDFILDTYLTLVQNTAAEMRSRNKVTMMYNNSTAHRWDKMRLIHPSNFNTIAMSVEVRTSLIEDINRFIRRKSFYSKVGKAWKRGYLLYGPPGTGKSSLVVAIANYLNFDIYQLQLGDVEDDSNLRKLINGIKNGSVLVLEDIDRQKLGKLSMSEILNSIDGIWSSGGEERIIIITTNNKDVIDEALLRPGRMDFHIHMGHCGFEAFKILASNYLSTSDHHLFPQIEMLLKEDLVTPAQVAEEFMRTDDADLAIGNLLKVLEEKMLGKMEVTTVSGSEDDGTGA